ncbi:MAG: hypothetical protein OJF47_001620 [Nitrospira sp.]|jgi:hypothetical protein|nr:MAG: hypothetical protein OJF47_001620 [Nitrospira sp.]
MRASSTWINVPVPPRVLDQGRIYALVGALLLGAHPSFAEWSVVTGASVSYTTNLFQFSSASRLAIEQDPSQPIVVRDTLSKPSDVIWQPSLRVARAWSSKLGTGEFSVKSEGAIYTRNPSFNNAYYRLALRQELEPKKTAVELIYRYTPHQLLGPGRVRSQSDDYDDVRTTSHVWRAHLERHITEQWALKLIGRYGLRLYNEPFTERDTRFWSTGPQIRFAPRPWSTITVTYLYERGLAAGRDDPQTDLDMSYFLHYASFGLQFRLANPLSLNLAYIYRFRGWTSDLAGDIEFGRRDVTHQGTGELRYAVSDSLHLSFGFQQTQQHSTLGSRSFHASTVSCGVEYRF